MTISSGCRASSANSAATAPSRLRTSPAGATTRTPPASRRWAPASCGVRGRPPGAPTATTVAHAVNSTSRRRRSITKASPAAAPANAHSGAMTSAASTVQHAGDPERVRRGTSGVVRSVEVAHRDPRHVSHAPRRRSSTSSTIATRDAPSSDSTSATSSLRCCVHSHDDRDRLLASARCHHPLKPPSTSCGVAERAVRSGRLPRSAVALAEHEPAAVDAVVDLDRLCGAVRPR